MADTIHVAESMIWIDQRLSNGGSAMSTTELIVNLVSMGLYLVWLGRIFATRQLSVGRLVVAFVVCPFAFRGVTIPMWPLMAIWVWSQPTPKDPLTPDDVRAAWHSVVSWVRTRVRNP